MFGRNECQNILTALGIAVVDGKRANRTSEVLAEGLGIEAGEFVVFYGKADLDWFAAYLAVFNVGLAADGQVQHHRNFFSTMWTGEFVFHWRRRYCNRSGRTTEPHSASA